MKALKTLLFPLIALPLFANAQEEPYFQQEVNYVIKARLDDINHRVNGSEKIEYINNSPDTLEFIWFHLWPNAYRNNHTALAQQLREKDSDKFQFAPDSLRGWIDSLEFITDKGAMRWEYHPKHIDICKVYLDKPLAPGAKTLLKISFVSKFSGDFSRMGHDGQSYQVTQWYPKPAVYDRDGWHEMPYLNQGEFYSEFGTFEVEITVPDNYRVAATGVLQDESEIKWLTELADDLNEVYPKKGIPFPESSTKFKTLHFKQDKIHDFAWFADKRYQVKKSQVTLESGKKVDTWVFYLGKTSSAWQHGANYIDSAVFYYSKWVGEYPYSAATAVEGPLSAGGGMEYPMVTVISAAGGAEALDNVITHEVGHNWFYGILASNERTQPWMDEGFNSYVEHRYMRKIYNRFSPVELGQMEKFITQDSTKKLIPGYIASELLASYGKQIPMASHSNEFGSLAYGLLSYMRTAYLLEYLEAYLGQEKFDKGMHVYFDRWKFKHPSPKDVQDAFEFASGEKLDWLFEALIQSEKQMDYSIRNAKINGDSVIVKVNNKGGVNSPYKLVFYKGKQVAKAYWVRGHEGVKKLSFPQEGFDRVEIDPEYYTPDLERRNNSSRLKGIFKRTEPIKLKLLTSVRLQDNSPINFLPIVAVNGQDRWMFGAALHNFNLLGTRFNYYFQPLYSSGDNTLAGNFILKYDFRLADKWFNKIRLTGQYKRYSGFDKISPALTLFFGGRRVDYAHNSFIQLSFNDIYNRIQDGVTPSHYQTSTLRFARLAKNKIFQRKTNAQISLINQANDPLLQVSLQLSESRKIARKWNITYHGFIGSFLGNSTVPLFFNMYTASGTDFEQNYILLDRRGTGKMGFIGDRQILNNEGMTKTENRFGTSVATIGFDIKRSRIPISLYANYGNVNKGTFYEIGAGLNLGSAVIYFPISTTLMESLAPKNFKEYAQFMRISFKMNLFQPMNSLETLF